MTWIAALGVHVMTYVAYGPLGPADGGGHLHRPADLDTGSDRCCFGYDDALDCDLNLFHNKDTVFFPEPVRRPDGE